MHEEQIFPWLATQSLRAEKIKDSTLLNYSGQILFVFLKEILFL